MAKDLRSFLRRLQEEAPEELRRVSREVSHEWEPLAVLGRLALEGEFPAVLFQRVRGYEFPVVANLLSTRKKFALALDTTEDRVAEVYGEREVRRIPPRRVETGPVKDVVYLGEEANLRRLPILVHYERNDGPYLSMGVLVAKDPRTGQPNLGIYRNRLIGRNRLGVYYSWGKRLHYIHRDAEARSESLECAIVLGMHPALHMASQTHLMKDSGGNEYEVAGGLLGEPLEVVRCETVDIEVPAHAEIVIEGRILPHVRQTEGPFGEYHHYYGQVVDAPLIEVTAITHRKDAIYQNVGGHVEQVTITRIPNEGTILRELRRIVPSVRAVHVPHSGVLYHVYIQLEKVNEGDAKNVLMAAITRGTCVKTAVAFDRDVDIFDERDVLWALSTRVVPDRDVFLVPGARGNRLDPTAYTLTRLQRDGMVTKMGIDATVPLGYEEPYPRRAKIPGADELRLENLLVPGMG
ncbi:MAG: UbiD family decarboxylase [Candidatus Tectomicrobia bacterium]|nr:UbiD family decarboxylase [Candidatus Tectomicrobia bacterium]